jgi:hypothetical protein
MTDLTEQLLDLARTPAAPNYQRTDVRALEKVLKPFDSNTDIDVSL